MAELKQTLSLIIQTGVLNHSSSLANLVSFSATSEEGDLELASLIFAQMQKPSTFSYNVMIRGYSNDGSRSPERALLLYLKMRREGTNADNYTYPFILKVCSLLLALEFGRCIHGKLFSSGHHSDMHTQSSLIRFYAECGLTECGSQVFAETTERDVILWNSILGCYAKSGVLGMARKLFDEMPERNSASYNAVIAGYVKVGDVGSARKLFDEMPQRDVVSWNTMVVGYARSGFVNEAHRLFCEMPCRNLSSWSGMITGLAQSSRFEEALDVFNEMMIEKVKPNQATLVGALSSCAHLGALEQGMWINAYIERSRFNVDDMLCAALIDMYSKCGLLEGAKFIFFKNREKDVCSWSAMICAFSMHGCCEEAIVLFEQMQNIGIKPNGITFVSILTACAHAGMVNKGKEIFHGMRMIHKIEPSIEHYTCMVDLLSRAGHLEQALNFVRTMPMAPDTFVWGSLVSGFMIHGSHHLLNENVAEELARLKHKDSGTYVLMSNLYASIDQWDDVMRLRGLMIDRGVQKNPGCSLIEVDGIVHEFLVGERTHPQCNEIYLLLNLLNRMVKIEEFAH
ncbi:pentatricopeptide repeat-containing protein At2g29760, chloroplastic-like [Nymphaea colorata]|uniref:Pentacotripeptide-repeat region of PRORP domain-containing protein n=1 Tax=Nymphaea colorata TaxID=210225 RepID=A0A5K1CZG1_9MAGN|nr:pentatricopeptide repeat-containing protein At2g29760, chloroplastic-like [Nymphaea colorata]